MPKSFVHFVYFVVRNLFAVESNHVLAQIPYRNRTQMNADSMNKHGFSSITRAKAPKNFVTFCNALKGQTPAPCCDNLTPPSCLGIIRPVSGEVPEWLNGTVSKTVVVLVATVGSNPTLSA